MAEVTFEVQLEGDAVDDFIAYSSALALVEKLVADGHDEDDVTVFISICDNREMTAKEFREEYG